jgi:hypothetical protein
VSAQLNPYLSFRDNTREAMEREDEGELRGIDA